MAFECMLRYLNKRIGLQLCINCAAQSGSVTRFDSFDCMF